MQGNRPVLLPRQPPPCNQFESWKLLPSAKTGQVEGGWMGQFSGQFPKETTSLCSFPCSLISLELVGSF